MHPSSAVLSFAQLQQQQQFVSPESGEGVLMDRSEKEPRERAISAAVLRQAGHNASVHSGEPNGFNHHQNGSSATTNTHSTSRQESYGLESYDSNEDGLCISFTSTEEESEGGEGANGERLGRKKSKLSFFKKMHKCKKRT
jgi:hypothetical protein